MQLTSTMRRARNLLMELLLVIAAGESCWYTINRDSDHEYSLARRLVFFLKEDYYAFLVLSGLASTKINPNTKEKEISIKKEQWYDLIDECHASSTTNTKDFELTAKRFDRAAAHKGKP